MHFPSLNRAGLSLLLGITNGFLWGGVYGWARQDFGGTHLLLWADANLYSQFFRWRGPQEPHPDVVILAIDETSQNLADLLTAEELETHPPLSQMTRSPWPRAVFAAVLEQLGSAGARVVAFDVVF
ncbi:MAG: CHASE2 domain-containing protein, partial [Cyanobacteriota bacterium]